MRPGLTSQIVSISCKYWIQHASLTSRQGVRIMRILPPFPPPPPPLFPPSNLSVLCSYEIRRGCLTDWPAVQMRQAMDVKEAELLGKLKAGMKDRMQHRVTAVMDDLDIDRLLHVSWLFPAHPPPPFPHPGDWCPLRSLLKAIVSPTLDIDCPLH